MKLTKYCDAYRKWGGIHTTRRTNFPPVDVSEFFDFKVLPKYLDREFLHQKYVVERLSTTEIAKQISSSKETVSRHLKAYGFEVRESGTNIRRWNQAYGIKLQKRRQTVDKREVETIEKMHTLREQGFSYWKIASILNSMKIPTKTRRAKWQARSIQRILETNPKSR